MEDTSYSHRALQTQSKTCCQPQGANASGRKRSREIISEKVGRSGFEEGMHRALDQMETYPRTKSSRNENTNSRMGEGDRTWRSVVSKWASRRKRAKR